MPGAVRKTLSGLGVAVVVLLVVVGIVAAWQLVSAPRRATAPPPEPGCRASVESQTADLSIEQARNAAIIAGVAAQRGLIPRAVSIALTTAFQESGLLNLDYGDRDSLGLFQQRPSQGWGTPEQIMDPYYATGKFYDVMVTIDDWPTADIGDVAQAVQRSGYPDAYDKHVTRARLLASALSGQTPAAWSCVIQNSAPGDPDQLLTSLTQAYGSTILAAVAPADADDPARITIDAVSEEVAWSVAGFAESWASRTGVTAVGVGAMSWQASGTEPAPWEETQAQTKPTTVVITF